MLLTSQKAWHSIVLALVLAKIAVKWSSILVGLVVGLIKGIGIILLHEGGSLRLVVGVARRGSLVVELGHGLAGGGRVWGLLGEGAVHLLGVVDVCLGC